MIGILLIVYCKQEMQEKIKQYKLEMTLYIFFSPENLALTQGLKKSKLKIRYEVDNFFVVLWEKVSLETVLPGDLFACLSEG